jgi:hypothetical protein
MANGWDVLANVINAVSRFPIERLFDRGPSDKALDALEVRLRDKGLLTGNPVLGNQPFSPFSVVGKEAKALELRSEGMEKTPEVLSHSTAASTLTATREETIAELKRRLGKELYRAELDLSNRLRIAGKPCDCLESKHNLGIEATAEELIPKEPENPVYREILDWFARNQSKVTIPAIMSGQYDDEYPMMAAEFTGFRKRVLGSGKLTAMIAPEKQVSLEEAKAAAAKLAQKEVEKEWHLTEKT